MKHEGPWGPIYYEVSGPSEAPAVLFTHGITVDHGAFDAQVAALGDRYRVVVWDLPGHGRSVPFSGEFRFEVMAGCLTRTLDAAEVASAVLVGQSIGSWVGQYVAHKHPQRVDALVDIGGTPLHQRMNPLLAFTWCHLLKMSVLIPERMFYRWFARERAFTSKTRE